MYRVLRRLTEKTLRLTDLPRSASLKGSIEILERVKARTSHMCIERVAWDIMVYNNRCISYCNHTEDSLQLVANEPSFKEDCTIRGCNCKEILRGASIREQQLIRKTAYCTLFCWILKLIIHMGQSYYKANVEMRLELDDYKGEADIDMLGMYTELEKLALMCDFSKEK